MDCSVLHMDSRQQMEQLDFRKRRVMMADTVCRLLEWVRMDNCHAINHMDVGKECNTCQIRYKKYRQEIARYIQ